MITQEQRKKLEKLWYEFGHTGPHMTIGNHKLLQRLLFVDGADLDESMARYNAMMDNDPDILATAMCLLLWMWRKGRLRQSPRFPIRAMFKADAWSL